MQNRDPQRAGAHRLTVARRLLVLARGAAAIAAIAFLVPAPVALASTGCLFPSRPEPSLVQDATGTIELAADFKAGHVPKPPTRGSSAELHGGSSADRYGGSSADRRGVAGRYDPRNRGVRQFSGGNRKHKERPKQSDELADQDEDPPQDRYSFSPPDPSQMGNRGDKD
jgi:hypothetical protein